MYTAAQAQSERNDAEFQRALTTNEALLRQSARDGGTWCQVYLGGDGKRMQAEMQARGFAATITHDGIGLKVSF